MSDFKIATTEALEFLRSKNKVGMISTVDSKGQPFVSPVYYAMGNEFDLFFLTSKSTHKALNIKENNRVAFSVGTGPDYIAVMIRGIANEVNSEEQSRALSSLTDILEGSKAFDWPVRKLEDLKAQNLVLYKLTPTEVTFLNINSKQEPKSVADYLYHLLG